MCAGRRAEQDHLETRPAPDELREFGSIREIGHMPTTRLLGEREFKAFAAQQALIDDREVAPERVDKPAGYAARNACLGFAKMMERIQVASPQPATPALENDAYAPQVW